MYGHSKIDSVGGLVQGVILINIYSVLIFVAIQTILVRNFGIIKIGEINMDLVTARAIRKKTQWDLRKLTGIHQSKISLIEHGYIVPDDSEKIAIARALNFAVNEINWPVSTECQQCA